MKKIFISYYALVMLILFTIYNLLLESLKIYGLLYQIFMFVIIIVNGIILIIFRKKIKYKTLISLVYLLIGLFSKNIFQYFFAFSNIILLCITGFMEKQLIKRSDILITTFCYIFLILLSFVFLFIFILGIGEERGITDIYEETHYYCDNNYEVYSYSIGATDKFHYSIGKYYKIINVEGMINISYSERNEKNYNEYVNYINIHNCKLVDDQIGMKYYRNNPVKM